MAVRKQKEWPKEMGLYRGYMVTVMPNGRFCADVRNPRRENTLKHLGEDSLKELQDKIDALIGPHPVRTLYAYTEPFTPRKVYVGGVGKGTFCDPEGTSIWGYKVLYDLEDEVAAQISTLQSQIFSIRGQIGALLRGHVVDTSDMERWIKQERDKMDEVRLARENTDGQTKPDPS